MIDVYKLARPLLFGLSAELAHKATLQALRTGMAPFMIPRGKYVRDPKLKTTVAGLEFPSPVGLAAGFDKDAEAIAALYGVGFGFVEAGTVTPLPQPGNPRPRAFRLVRDRAVINRYGFNSKGLDAFVARLAALPDSQTRRAMGWGPLGANIGANKTSSDPAADYVTGLKAVHGLADYITVNISSPNTPGLRDLQQEDSLNALLARLAEARTAASDRDGTIKPLFLKFAPDIATDAVPKLADICVTAGVDAIIIGNTTISRPDHLISRHRGEQGGLSGRPLKQLAEDMLSRFASHLQGALPLIAVGGIASANDVITRLDQGASLVQIYSALVYEGFGLIDRINRELAGR